jgi:peptidoglycan/xylan/chitin deacetylase (PgdA/CDA1 family)
MPKRAGPSIVERWPDNCKAAVILSFDFDAESDELRSAPNKIVPISKGMYGPTVGLQRILNLLEDFEVPATFFVPGWVAQNHKDRVRETHARRFEIAGHGYMHEKVSEMSLEEETAVLQKCVDGIKEAIGTNPTGYRAPWFDFGKNSLSLLGKFSFEYDSSLMSQDLPYLVNVDGKLLVELPVDWSLDDYPAFEVDRKPPAQVRETWQAEFDALYRDHSLFNLTMHPECIGRPARIGMLRDFVRYMKSKPKVWFASANEVAEWWRTAHSDEVPFESTYLHHGV